MDFSELQHSWQRQAAPPVTPHASAATDSLLAETQRLHRFGRRRNRLGTGLIGLALACFLGGQLLRDRPHTPLQYAGLALLAGTLLGFVALAWWGTGLRRAAQPGLDSRTYVRASLRAFRFRRGALLWLGIPYALGFGAGLVLWNLPHFRAAVPSDWWLLGLGLPVLAGLALAGRAVGLRRYEQKFGPTERELERWQAAWPEENVVNS